MSSSPQNDECRGPDLCRETSKVCRRQCLAGEGIALAAALFQRCTNILYGGIIALDRGSGEPDFQQCIYQRAAAGLAVGGGARSRHGSHLIGITRRCIDQDQTVDQFRVRGREVLGDQPAKGNAGQVNVACPVFRDQSIVGNPEALGYGIVREQQALHPEFMFAYVAVVGLLGVILNAGVLAVTQALWPWTAPRQVA